MSIKSPSTFEIFIYIARLIIKIPFIDKYFPVAYFLYWFLKSNYYGVV